MEKSPDAFRTISEVAEWLGVQAHVLRFWESKFSQVKPVKRAGGRRYYRPTDMLLLGGIRKLLHEDGMTIKGVQKILREQGVAHVAGMSPALGDGAAEAVPLRTVEPAADTPVAAAPPPPARDAGQIELSIEPQPAAEPDEPPAPEPAPVAASDAAETPADEPGAAPVAQSPFDAPEAMPSFRHRRITPEEPKEPAAAAAESAPAESPAPPRPRIVDAPDPPEDDEIAAPPGILAGLAPLRRLPPDRAGDIAALAAELAAWYEARISQAGAR